MADNSGLSDIKKEIGKNKPGISETRAAAASAGKAPDKAVTVTATAGESSPPSESPSAGPSLGTKLGDIADNLSMQDSGDSTKGAGQAAQKVQAGPASQHNPDQIKKQITDIVNKKVSSKISGMQENLKGLDKISGLEAKINQMAEKLGNQMFQPAPQARPAQGGGSSISRELASFGEEVDFQTELYETKKVMAGIAKSLDTLSKKMEYRISILEDRSKTLERIPDLEERLQDIRQKLGPENVQKLRKLIFSSDEIVDEVIPDLVNKKLRSKLDPAMNELRDMQETINDFNSRLSHMREEVLNLEKLRDDIQELRADKEDLYKTLDEESARENERLDILKQNVKRKIDGVTDQFKQGFRDLRKTQGDHIKSEVNQAFTNLIDPRFTDTEKNQVIFDEKLRRLVQAGASLEKKVDSIEAPENVRKWLEGRVSKLERGIVSDISGLQGKSLANSAGISKIAEDLKTFKVAMADVPKRLGNQGNMINKLLDTKDYFVSTSEILGADLKVLSEKLSGLQAGHAGLDQRMSNQESRFADSLNKQRDYLTASKDDMSRHLDREITSIRKTLEKKSREESRSSLAEFKAEIKRLSSTEEEIKAMRRSNDASISRLGKQVGDLQGGLKEAYPEIKLMETRLAELDNAYKGLTTSLAEASEYHKTSDSVIKSQLMKYVEGSMRSLKKEIEERRNADAKAQLREFKEELKRLESMGQELSVFRSSHEKRVDELSQEMSSLSGPLTDLRALGKKVSGLEEILIAADKRTDADRDRRTEQLNSLENRFNLIEKALGDLGSSQSMLEKRVISDNERLQKALSGVISDKGLLEKEFSAQKSKMIELIRELKNL